MKYRDDIKEVASDSHLTWEKLTNSNILVTGASGLLGSTLIDILMSSPYSCNYNVYAGVREKSRGDLILAKYPDASNLHIIKYDVIIPLESNIDFHYMIHCASGAAPANFAKHPVEVMKANFFGVSNLLDYGRKHQLKRMLYVSTGEVYGEGDGRIFTEDYSGYVNPVLSRSCYPSSKRASETLCISYIEEYNLDIVIARPCHIYGPHFTNTDNRVYAQFLRNIVNNEDIVLNSPGTQYRSWCYVVDCCSAFLYILLYGQKGEAYNIADEDSNITIRELAKIIASNRGKRVVLDVPGKIDICSNNPVSKSVFSTKKIESLGWKPKTHINEGISKTIEELLYG